MAVLIFPTAPLIPLTMLLNVELTEVAIFEKMLLKKLYIDCSTDTIVL